MLAAWSNPLLLVPGREKIASSAAPSVMAGPPGQSPGAGFRPAILGFTDRNTESRGWCAFARHDAVGNAFVNGSTYSVTLP